VQNGTPIIEAMTIDVGRQVVGFPDAVFYGARVDARSIALVQCSSVCNERAHAGLLLVELPAAIGFAHVLQREASGCS